MELRASSPFWSFALAVALSVQMSTTWAADKAKPVDFNRDILPILSDHCFTCHGPDANKRDADLRLDTREGIFEDRGGYQTVTPGNAAASELYLRIITADDFELMPPSSSNHRLTAVQVDLIKRWIDDGAPYETHWAYVAPKQPPLPKLKEQSWPRNAIDHFILARLESEGLRPSPEADRATLLRRLSFDLTGLPPTPAEVKAFVTDKSPNAYEKQVDRLLASPHYGENMARMWLDLARYADTSGLGGDNLLVAWPWRDWVIKAYNRNMTYDQFTIRQIAGDLLPNATLDDKIATGFNRNNVTEFNDDDSQSDEESRTENVVDRVNTVGTTWLGLTVGCARCHDHKYDPIKQKDFYSLYGFFNDLVEGERTVNGNPSPVVSMASPAQKQRDEELQRGISTALGVLPEKNVVEQENRWRETALTTLKAEAPKDGLLAHYEFAGNLADSSGHNPNVKVTGNTRYEDGVGGQALRLVGDTRLDFGQLGDFERSQSFSFAFWLNAFGQSARAVFQKHDASQNWQGYEISLEDPSLAGDYRTHFRIAVRMASSWPDGAIAVRSKTRCISTPPSSAMMSPDDVLPHTRHLIVSYDGSGRASGITLYLNGRPLEMETVKDSLAGNFQTSAALTSGDEKLGLPFLGKISDLRVYERTLSATESENLAVYFPTRTLLTELSGRPVSQIAALQPEESVSTEEETPADKPKEKATVAQTPADKTYARMQRWLSDFFLKLYAPEEERRAYERLLELRDERSELAGAMPTAMVMSRMKKPRETFVLGRGQYDNPKEGVTPDAPRFLLPLGKDAPRNRLTLAQWLVDPENPLTARVEVNRYWQNYFGIGLVKTAEDFGSQGERPSHQELLDWLATEFMRTGWDIKAMQRLIVTSATYRQSSKLTRELRERDPENRLLARGPRVRLAAEQIRDNALAVSGLLTAKIGGPSVFAYAPAGLWRNEYGDDTYTQATGEDLYRRSLYTVWKRTISPASFASFDIPTRERCTARRVNTNTPLQALALLNDPTYVEASRILAERVIVGAQKDAAHRVESVFRLVMQRDPRPQERALLLQQAQRMFAQFQRDPAAASKLLSIGESQRNPTLDPAELAAWTMVSRTVLNLNEAITKQ